MSDTPSRPKSPYIVGPLYDWVWFLLPPVVGLGLGILLAGSPLRTTRFLFNGEQVTPAGMFLGTLIHAHLVAVFLRSHTNPSIFKRFPIRFVLVPCLIWLAVASSLWAAVIAAVVATFWDVWHSGAQTFGFARIYDRNHHNAPEVGRKLDFWLNQLVYAGPIMAGATLMDHVRAFENFESVNSLFFTSIPARVQGHARILTWTVLAAGFLFILYYIFAYWRFYRQGYRFSLHKTYLLISTALCSIYSWGFNTWGEAFFIMNFFHAVQYLGLIWATESKRLTRLLRLDGLHHGRFWCGTLFVLALFSYGFFANSVNPDKRAFWGITIVVSLMHFWYDSFIWSVREKAI